MHGKAAGVEFCEVSPSHLSRGCMRACPPNRFTFRQDAQCPPPRAGLGPEQVIDFLLPEFPTPPRGLTFSTSVLRLITFTTMEPATPPKFRSNVLAALDFKPDLDGLNNCSSLLNRTKRKQAPGSPDPRRPKRITAGVRLNIPGLENETCGCSSVRQSKTDLILLSYPVSSVLQPPPGTAGLPRDHRQEFGINYNEEAPVSRLDLAAPDQQEQ